MSFENRENSNNTNDLELRLKNFNIAFLIGLVCSCLTFGFNLLALIGNIINSAKVIPMLSSILSILSTIGFIVSFIMIFIGFGNLSDYLPSKAISKVKFIGFMFLTIGIIYIISFILSIINSIVITAFLSVNYQINIPFGNSLNAQSMLIFAIIFFVLDLILLIMYLITIFFMRQLVKENKPIFYNISGNFFSFIGLIIAIILNIVLSIVLRLTVDMSSGTIIIATVNSLLIIPVHIEFFLFSKNLEIQMFSEENISKIDTEQISKQKDQTQSILNKSSTDKMTLLLICFFLGGLGVHRFMNGKTLSGVLYLCTGGLFGIGVLYDLIMILTDKFTDADGNIITNKNIIQQQPKVTQQQPQKVHPKMQEAMSKAVESTLESELEEKIKFMAPGEIVELNDIASYYGCNQEQVEAVIKKLLEEGKIWGSLNPFKGTFTVK